MVSLAIHGTSAVTYEFSGGRFGDNLIAYCHAKWIAYKNNIPLLYRPFEYSDGLVLHQVELHYTQKRVEGFKQVVYITHHNCIIKRNADILYVVPYFAESPFEASDSACFAVEWQNEGFLKLLNSLIKPSVSFQSAEIPHNHLSVAVHVRKGGSYWDEAENLSWKIPHKCPPDSYYIEQIQWLADQFTTQKLYVHLFTDHQDPLFLFHHYQQAVDRKNVVFACRQKDNDYNKNVLDDFFALMRFDFLIRPDSNFSLMAAKLHRYKMQIYPHQISQHNRIVTIQKVKRESGA